MSSKDPGTDGSFEFLRRAHRFERAPEPLRRRVLERVRSGRSFSHRGRSRAGEWLARGALLGLAVCLIGGVWLGVSNWSGEGSGSGAAAEARSDVVPMAEPRALPGGFSQRCPQPLPTSRWNPAAESSQSKAAGFDTQLFVTQTDCGPLTRRYLVRVPSGDASTAPVLIVLHDGGQSAEQAQSSTRWWFDDLAQRQHVVLAYAHGGPIVAGAGPRASAGSVASAGTNLDGGIWQTDEGAHSAVNDFDYLQGIVDDLQSRRGLAWSGEVLLAGYGSGAVMALTAAVRHPERYSGVAAFLPSRPLREGDLDSGARQAFGAGWRLRSVFVVLPHAASDDASGLAFQWAAALGGEPDGVHVLRKKPGIQRIDAGLVHGVALQILRLSDAVDPFPPPGAADQLAREASEARPFFFDGPEAAWAFFRRPNP